MKRKSKSKKYDPIKVAQAAARRAHFANGGSLATWRGRAHVEKDRKKEQAKKACRKRVAW